MRYRTGLLITAIALGGCLHWGRAGTSTAPLTAAEISRIDVRTAYDAVERLRPEFLRTRGTTSMITAAPDAVIVYVDGVRFGGAEALREIPAELVVSIIRISAADANMKHGLGHTVGALEVRTHP